MVALDVAVDYTTNAWNDFECALGTASFFWFNAMKSLQDGTLSLGGYEGGLLLYLFGGVLGFLTLFVAVLVKIGDQGSNFQLPPSVKAIPIVPTSHDSEAIVEIKLTPPSQPLFGQLVLDQAGAKPTGPLLLGKIVSPQSIVTAPLAVLALPFSCGP